MRLFAAIVIVIYIRLCMCTNSTQENGPFYNDGGHYGPWFTAALHKHKRHRDVRRTPSLISERTQLI